MWCLEILRFVHDVDQGGTGNKLTHVGYMDAHFKTRNDAASYYNRHNPHMRPLNAHGTWISDWDPDTHFKYAVRKDHHVAMTVAPFDPKDASVTTQCNNGNKTRWRWAK